jgi:hypothetical protein
MILLIMCLAPVFLVCPLDAVHACPTGVPSRPTPKATELDLWKGTPACLGGRSPHLAEAPRSGFWERERASEGRGCFERGTLNADRKANRKGAALFNDLPDGLAEELKRKTARVLRLRTLRMLRWGDNSQVSAFLFCASLRMTKHGGGGRSGLVQDRYSFAF